MNFQPEKHSPRGSTMSAAKSNTTNIVKMDDEERRVTRRLRMAETQQTLQSGQAAIDEVVRLGKELKEIRAALRLVRPGTLKALALEKKIEDLIKEQNRQHNGALQQYEALKRNVFERDSAKDSGEGSDD